MKYHVINDVYCPNCKNNTFKIENHKEQRTRKDMTNNEGEDEYLYLLYREIYCDKCFTTIERIDT